MKKIKNFLIIGFLITLLFSGCMKQESYETLPDLKIPEDQMNTYIDLTVVPYLTNLKVDKPVELLIQLASNNPVITKTDGNIEMYIYDDEKKEWKKVNDLREYPYPNSRFVPVSPEVTDIVLEPGEEGKEGFFIGLYPALQDYSKAVRLLVVAYGHLYMDGQKTDQEVGAYEILTLHP